MAYPTIDPRFLDDVIKQEEVYLDEFHRFLDACGQSSLNALTLYATAAPAPVTRTLMTAIGVLANADVELLQYAESVKAWHMQLRTLMALENVVGNAANELELRGSQGSPTHVFGPTPEQLSMRHAELEAMRKSAVRDGLGNRFRAMQRCGQMWTMMAGNGLYILDKQEVTPPIFYPSPPPPGVPLVDQYSETEHRRPLTPVPEVETPYQGVDAGRPEPSDGYSNSAKPREVQGKRQEPGSMSLGYSTRSNSVDLETRHTAVGTPRPEGEAADHGNREQQQERPPSVHGGDIAREGSWRRGQPATAPFADEDSNHSPISPQPTRRAPPASSSSSLSQIDTISVADTNGPEDHRTTSEFPVLRGSFPTSPVAQRPLDTLPHSKVESRRMSHAPPSSPYSLQAVGSPPPTSLTANGLDLSPQAGRPQTPRSTSGSSNSPSKRSESGWSGETLVHPRDRWSVPLQSWYPYAAYPSGYGAAPSPAYSSPYAPPSYGHPSDSHYHRSYSSGTRHSAYSSNSQNSYKDLTRVAYS